MKSIIKYLRYIAVIVVFSILFTSIPASAVSLGKYTTIELDSGKKITLTKQQLDDIINITQDEAQGMALLFVADMIEAGMASWDENTEITSIVPMYDNTNTDTVTAYTVNLTKGYVVVSAFLDAESKIPEWSDEATPLYQELDREENDKVIYLGGYEYYTDSDRGTMKSLSGEFVEKSSVDNIVCQSRELENIPSVTFECYIQNDAITRGTPISNMYNHANANYAGPFVLYETRDNWSTHLTYYTIDYPKSIGYYGSCVPVAITNSLYAYKHRYPASAPTIENTCSQIVQSVINYGISAQYYFPSNNPPGVPQNKVRQYIGGIYANYGLVPTLTAVSALSSYANVKSQLDANKLILICTDDDSTYGDHAILCHGISRLCSNTTGNYLSYIHIADGWSTSIRYSYVGWNLNYYSVIMGY